LEIVKDVWLCVLANGHAAYPRSVTANGAKSTDLTGGRPHLY